MRNWIYINFWMSLSDFFVQFQEKFNRDLDFHFYSSLMYPWVHKWPGYDEIDKCMKHMIPWNSMLKIRANIYGAVFESGDAEKS